MLIGYCRRLKGRKEELSGSEDEIRVRVENRV
jgi:hypothetical protein